ncbi:MAG: DUF3418 domain-containing protein [Phycisphaeraceae bacterium]
MPTPDLPILAHRDEIARLIAAHPVAIVCGETGSGKSTQLPQICRAMGRGAPVMIGQTQPRRIAARSIAARIAQEMSVTLGREVGYKIRFTDRVSRDTRIKIMTDGILLSETQQDPMLRRYDTLIIDEAHERSLNIDFLLGFLKQLLPRRRDLKVIITSATIDPQRFSDFFDGAPIVEVSGRMYPVEVRYRPGGLPPLPSEGEGGGQGAPNDLVPTDRQQLPSHPHPNPLPVKGEGADTDSQDADLPDAIVLALREIIAGESLPVDQPRDVLVFLPGEREIRETAEAITAAKFPNVELMPLYARLPPDQQMRIFQPHRGRRIVLATNVAETSLTVPGIRYVIDSGLARLSRYSPRHKVQRLPIEEISRASADQRMGRCGRVADGVCIRLYSRDDYQARPAFTDPEILRTNLAGAILQMKALRLGDVEAFPFIEPPSRRMIRDGYDTLVELGALDDELALTAVGRQLARLPIDPRLGRMILAARQEHCLPQVLIITAALAAGDPRLRPVGQEAAADSAHVAFHHSESDFLGYLTLWRFFQNRARELSQSKLRKLCAARFLSYVRLREWQDIHRQLGEMSGPLSLLRERAGVRVPADEQGEESGEDERPASDSSSRPECSAVPESVRPSPLPKEEGAGVSYAAIHRALLTGLLSSIGHRSDTGEYDGPRGVKFWLFPGSGLFDQKPRWVVAAELVETTKLYARTVARISPHWVERLAPHLVQRQYADPHWRAKTGDVEAFETVTLMSLPIITRRRVPYGRIDARIAREIFIYEALVEGRYRTEAPFALHNHAVIEEAKQIQAKQRRGDLLAGADRHYAFFDQRVPPQIYNTRRFEHWRHRIEKDQPRLLFMKLSDVMRLEPPADTHAQFPDHLHTTQITLPVEYRLDPGDPADGMSVLVPIAALNQLRPQRFDWLVPGMLAEKVEALLRSLPKVLRVQLIPIGQVARACARNLEPGDRALTEALADELRRRSGVDVPAQAWNQRHLADHLRAHFRVIDERGQEIAAGRDLRALQERLGSRSAASNAAIFARQFARDGITQWDFGDLPDHAQAVTAGVAVQGYPAIVDHGHTVALRMIDARDKALRLNRAGLRRLFMLQLAEEVGEIAGDIPEGEDLAALYAPLGGAAELREQLVVAMIDRVFLEDQPGGPEVRTHMEFELRLRAGRGRLRAAMRALITLVQPILAAFAQLTGQLEQAIPPAWETSVRDMRAQLAHLMPRQFLTQTPALRLTHYPRYLAAMQRRWSKLPGRLARDREMAAELAPYWQAYVDRVTPIDTDVRDDPALETYRWMLEEMRVSLFAQELRTVTPVSFRRLDEQWTLVRKD